MPRSCTYASENTAEIERSLVYKGRNLALYDGICCRHIFHTMLIFSLVA